MIIDKDDQHIPKYIIHKMILLFYENYILHMGVNLLIRTRGDSISTVTRWGDLMNVGLLFYYWIKY